MMWSLLSVFGSCGTESAGDSRTSRDDGGESGEGSPPPSTDLSGTATASDSGSADTGETGTKPTEPATGVRALTGSRTSDDCTAWVAGAATGSVFGTSVATMEDITGDGVPDTAIGDKPGVCALGGVHPSRLAH